MWKPIALNCSLLSIWWQWDSRYLCPHIMVGYIPSNHIVLPFCLLKSQFCCHWCCWNSISIKSQNTNMISPSDFTKRSRFQSHHLSISIIFQLFPRDFHHFQRFPPSAVHLKTAKHRRPDVHCARPKRAACRCDGPGHWPHGANSEWWMVMNIKYDP